MDAARGKWCSRCGHGADLITPPVPSRTTRPPLSPGEKRWIAIGVVTVAAVVCLVWIGTWLSRLIPSLDAYEDTVQRVIPSPDGRYVALIFWGEGGATMGPGGAHVNLRKNTPAIPPSGSRYRRYQADGAVFASDGGPGYIDVVWKDATHLAITSRAGRESAYRKESSWEDVTLSYRFDDRRTLP